MKKAMILILSALFLLASCTKQSGGDPITPIESALHTPEPSDPVWVRLGLLKGPIGLAGLRLMKEGGAENQYDVTVSAANDEIVAGLTSGSLDIAGMATNLAANLYHKTDGSVQIIAVVTLGVLYVLENGDSVQSVADLAGKTVYAMGQGANPEYVLRHLVEQNGGRYDDMTVEWRTQEEITAIMLSGDAAICMLPVPAATTVLMKNSDVRTALNLTEEWAAVPPGSPLAQSCFVARTEFIEEHPAAVQSFLADLAASVDTVTANPEQAGAWAEEYAIVPAAAVAAAAIPQANLVCITGTDMQAAAQGYFEVLFAADPASIGGFSPDDAFYYLAE